MNKANLPMAFTTISIAFLLYLVSLGCCNEEAGSTHRKADLGLEKDLQFHTKQEVASIHIEFGDTYDCIDFYKQPAFRHPLLKNITLQTRQSYLSKTSEDNARKPFRIGDLKGRGCPTGTVPIIRSSENNRIKSDSVSKTKISNMNPFGDNEGHHYAIVRTKANPSKKFLGAEFTFSLHNPQVSGSQFSASRMKISNGPDNIQVGWMVSIDQFEDNRTHLFGQFTAGGTQCFNPVCPGFVQVSSEIPLGGYVKKTSVVGGPIYVWTLAIAKDPKDGNWWLYFGNDMKRVGYWPKNLFTDLADFASQVQWGGEVFAPPGQVPPKMGTGLFPVIRSTAYAAYFRHITVLDESFHYVNAEDTETYTDGKFAYAIVDVGYQGKFWGHLMLFGGHG